MKKFTGILLISLALGFISNTGVELGINWKPIDHLFINAAVWYLALHQEFVYDGDEGTSNLRHLSLCTHPILKMEW